MAGEAWKIEPLGKRHDRSGFDCGSEALNRFLRDFARQNQEENVGRTYVLVRPGDRRVLGFHTLTVATVERETLAAEEARRLPRYPVPVARLARLGVDLSARGEGLGAMLLVHALELAVKVSEVVGIFAIEVQAKDAVAREFYEHFGFRALRDEEQHLYLSIRAARKALA